MESLYALATKLEIDDKIRWVGKKADISEFQNVGLNIIDEIHRDADRITVEAIGPNGAEVGFWVDREGESRVHHQGTPQGEMEQVQVPQKNLLYVDK